MASDHRVPRAFIFDCDGTLLDSMGMWLSIQPELLARHGIETVPSDFARFEHLARGRVPGLSRYLGNLLRWC